jgi:hypothetical protein
MIIPSVVKVGFFIDWKLNQKEITEKYCVNKDKPEKECNGCCHYEKQIEKVEKAEPKEPNFPYTLLSKNTVSEYLEPYFDRLPSYQSYSIFCFFTMNGFKPFLFLYKKDLFKNIFHPPII